MTMPYLPSSSGDLEIVGLLLLLLFPVWFAVMLFYNGKALRFASRHPEVSGAYSLSRLKARCILLALLLLVCLGLGLWRLLPRSMNSALDLEPTQLTATVTEPVVTPSGTAREQRTTLGPLEGPASRPVLDALEAITLRPDFHNLLPLELPVDARLTGGRRAVLTLTDDRGETRQLTFYGTHLLTVRGDGPLRRYRFYDPLQAQALLTLLQDPASGGLLPHLSSAS